MSHLIAFLALLSIAATYTEVAQMNAPRPVLLFRLIPPVLIYTAFFLSFTYVPALLLWSILAWLLYLLIRSGLATYKGYRASQRTDPPTTAEWFKPIRFAPHLMGGLLVVYIVTVMVGKVQSPVQAPAYEPASEAVIQSKPTQEELTDEEEWERLKKQQP